MPVSGATRGEHHRAAGRRATVHFAEMHGREVNLQCALVAEGLHAHVALNAFLAVRTNENALFA